MLARLPRYRFRTGDGAARLEIMEYAERDRFSPDYMSTGADRLLTRNVGELPIRARLFSAIVMPGERPEAGPLTRDLPGVLILRDMKPVLEPWFRAAIEFMSTGSCEPEPGASAMAERLIEMTFIAALRRWLLDDRPERGWMRGLTDPAISRVLNAVHAQPGRRWTLAGLAVVAGRSRSGLAKQFHEVMDETLFGYIARWRMHLGEAAIAQGERSTSEIASSLGYEGPRTFSRAFVASFGVTPAQYRRSAARERRAS
jgi:AraC-like DNA-binding protein